MDFKINEKMRKLIFPLLFICVNFPVLLMGQVKKEIILVIDPGHGGQDPGKPKSISYYKHEKDINLSIALSLGDYIDSKIPGVKVLYTRTTDIYVSLEDRVDFANANKADYFISIHCNSSPYKKVYGSSTHIHTKQSTASRRLAELIEWEFANKLNRNSLGVKDEIARGHSLYVLKYTKMPSVLVETGFLSNVEEEKYLNSEEGQLYVAAAIYRAFNNFLQNRVLSSSNNNTTQQKTNTSSLSFQYKIQIAASDKALYLKSQKFLNLGMPIEEQIDGTSRFPYKYFVGNTSSMSAAKELLLKVQSLGFADAYIVKFWSFNPIYYRFYEL